MRGIEQQQPDRLDEADQPDQPPAEQAHEQARDDRRQDDEPARARRRPGERGP